MSLLSEERGICLLMEVVVLPWRGGGGIPMTALGVGPIR